MCVCVCVSSCEYAGLAAMLSPHSVLFIPRMFSHAYIHMHIYIHIYIFIYICTHAIHIYVYTYIRIHVYTRIYMYMCVQYPSAYMCTHTHTTHLHTIREKQKCVYFYVKKKTILSHNTTAPHITQNHSSHKTTHPWKK
jgi:hypothetical protein